MTEQSSMLAIYGPQLLEQGYEIVPIRSGLKHPGMRHWQSVVSDAANLSHWLDNGHRDGGVGIRTRHTPAVDVDILDAEAAAEMDAFVVKLLGETPRRVGLAPKCARLYRTETPFAKVASPVYEDWLGQRHKLEVLGDGQQIVAYHIHPDTGEPYKWSGDGVAGIKASSLPTITAEHARVLVAHMAVLAERYGWEVVSEGSSSGSAGADWRDDLAGLDGEERALANYAPRLGITLEEAQRRIRAFDATDRDQWIRVGMALYHEFKGSEEAFNLWDQWSATASNYGGVEWYRWEGFKNDDSARRPVTMRAFSKGGELGDGDGDGEDDEGHEAWLDEFGDPMPAANEEGYKGFKTFTWDDARSDAPPPHQIVENLLALGQVSVVSAQPNTGKSALALDLGVHVAAGREWRGLQVEGSGVLYVAAESPETIRARVIAMKRELDLRGIPFHVTQDPINLSTDVSRAAFKARLKATVQRMGGAQLIIIDTFRAATPGLKENDAAEMGAAVAVATSVAHKQNIHVMIIHHTTKAGGAASGSGVMLANIDTELLVYRGEDEMAGLVCASVRQQRSMNSVGLDMWYEIRSAETGRVTNFGKPETAPLVKHLSQVEIDFMVSERLEKAEAARAESDRRVLEERVEDLVRLMRMGTPGALIAHELGVSKTTLGVVRQAGVEMGKLTKVGEGNGARYSLTEGTEGAGQTAPEE